MQLACKGGIFGVSTPLLLGNGSAAVPSLSFIDDTDTGFWVDAANNIYVTLGGSTLYSFLPTYMDMGMPLRLGGAGGVFLNNEAADTMSLRNSTNPNTFKVYETYTDVNNYERYAFIASGNQLEIQAQTLGTGADDLDILFTPAGTGNVKFGGLANGQQISYKSLTELTTIAAAATTTTTIAIPANVIVKAVSVRVTVVIPTAATFTVIGNTSTTAFNTAAVSTAATSTDKGNLNCPYNNGAAQTIRITPNATPADNTGRVRITIWYEDSIPATS